MRPLLFPLLSLSLLPALVACQSEPAAPPAPPAEKASAEATAAPAVDKAVLAAFAPLPEHFGEEAPDAVWQLGKQLYFDKRLSKNHDISCNSCHDLKRYGVDNEPTSPGHKGQRGGRNSPTVLNAAGHFAQFWDGRAKDVEEQALGPMLNPVEMAAPSEDTVLAVLRSIPAYTSAFDAAFPGEGLTWTNVGNAIGAFERKLVTPSRFDAFLKGDEKALTTDEQRGLNTFVATGCTACHSGALLGGTTYQKLGAVTPWPGIADKGRADVTNADADLHFFKVPSLRNIAKTGPYFHDGKVASLDEAVTLMARHQLGKELEPAAVKDIVTFLNALTGELPAALAQEPTLPPSTDKTPKPDPS